MLQQVCEHIHNYFIQHTYTGSWTIAGGVLSLPFLLDGQRFWITGSVLNDGVYTYHAAGIKNDDNKKAAGLADETFTGTVCAMAIPRDVLGLVDEIGAWQDKYGAASESPYSSETVNGVYTYTKAVKSEGAGGGSYGWQDVYRSRLNRWRKPCL